MLITEKDKKLNIDLDKDNKLDLCAWKDLYGSHLKVGNKVYGDFPKINKLDDYFYQITVDEMDEKYAYEAIDNAIVGGCSSFRFGDFIARSYDWYYNNSVTFKIDVPAKEGRLASTGVAQCKITQNEMTAESYNEALKLMPFQTLDGKNEAGVYCSTNVVPTGDKGITIGTRPGAKDLCQICIPRLVLDKASSAREALDLINNCNVFSPVINGHRQELHTMICNDAVSYVVEFINNKMHVLSSDPDDEFDNLPNNLCIMTNFYLTDWNGETKAVYRGDSVDEVKSTGLTAYSAGLERYDLIQAGISNVDSESKATELIQQVQYTKAYKSDTNPFWYSEVVGYTPTYGDLSIYNTSDDFTGIIAKMQEMYESRSREKGDTWQSVHQSVYNLNEHKLTVYVQEKFDSAHEFETV